MMSLANQRDLLIASEILHECDDDTDNATDDQSLHAAAGNERGLLTFWRREKKSSSAESEEQLAAQNDKSDSESESESESTSNETPAKSAGMLQKMRDAYDTYKTLAALRKRTTVSGLAVGALPLAAKAVRWWLGMAAPDTDVSRCSIGSALSLFLLGTATGFAVHSELRWYFRDRHEHADAKKRALVAARAVVKQGETVTGMASAEHSQDDDAERYGASDDNHPLDFEPLDVAECSQEIASIVGNAK